MTIQRAVVSGTIASEVQIRNMFTCNVVESGGDDAALLWSTYLESLYGAVEELLWEGVSFNTYELQNYSAGSWIPFDVEDFAHTGLITGEQIANSVAMVVLGKAEGLRHIGRKFFSALGAQRVNGNVWDPAFVALPAAVLVNYVTPFTGIGGGTITPGVVDGSGTFHPFVGGVVSSLLGSMRRRKPGLGI